MGLGERQGRRTRNDARTPAYVRLPISIVGGLFFVWQGMSQNLNAYTEVATLEGGSK
jgi:potassium-transporting ATPase potassium-binding subunit